MIERVLLKKFRGDRSQKEMAKRYRVTQQTWCNWEIGKASPRPKHMQQIARDSGYSIQDLFF